MKYAGLVLAVLGVVILLIGAVVVAATVTSTYAPNICARAEKDKDAAREAKARCGDVTSRCYRDATDTLTTETECDNAKSFMNKQLIMGIVPIVIGGLMSVIGLAVFFVFMRRKRTA